MPLCLSVSVLSVAALMLQWQRSVISKRGGQTFSEKSQIINILDFASQMLSVMNVRKVQSLSIYTIVATKPGLRDHIA